MSDTYTPDEEQVREQYTQEQPPQIGTVAEKHAEFDRFIARVKADALREALLSDEAVERVADILEALDGDDYLTVARAALTAALGEDEDNE